MRSLIPLPALLFGLLLPAIGACHSATFDPAPVSMAGSKLISSLPAVRCVTGGDFNGDGVRDLLAGDGVDLKLLVGDGRGGFTESGTLEPPPGPFNGCPRVADLSVRWGDGKDGRGDLLLPWVEEATNHSYYVYWAALGGGKFSAPRVIELAGAAHLYTMELGHLDGDGYLDAVVPGDREIGIESLGLYRGKGDGTFERTGTYLPFPVLPRGGWVQKILLSDLDRDGTTDLLVVRGNSIAVGRGDGRGGFLPARVLSPGAGLPAINLIDPADWQESIAAVVLADTRGTGWADLVVSQAGNDAYAYVLPAMRDGTFGEPIVTPSVIGAPAQPWDTPDWPLNLAWAADYNGDGRLDLPGSGIGLGLGDGRFIVPPMGRGPLHGLVHDAADYDGDGMLDAVVSEFAEGGALYVNRNTTLQQ